MGVEGAWAEIYRDLAPGILGYLRGRGAAEPEDLLGEVFLQAVRDLGDFDGGEREFRAWMFTIAHHRLLDEARRRDRRPVEPSSDETLVEHAPIGDAEADALERLGRQRVEALIAGLPRDQQSVLLLRILGGLTVSEVARLIGKRPGAVKALQRRALAAVKQTLEKDGDQA